MVAVTAGDGWWLYVLGARVQGVALVKVGESRNPMQRMAQLHQLLLLIGVPRTRQLGVSRGRDRPWHDRLRAHLGDHVPVARYVRAVLLDQARDAGIVCPAPASFVETLAPTEWYPAHRVLPQLRDVIHDPATLRALDDQALRQQLLGQDLLDDPALLEQVTGDHRA